VSAPRKCPECGADLATPLLCESCGALLAVEGEYSPFRVLGLEPAFEVDTGAARKRLLALSRALHPDFHSNADERTRERAQDATAALNAAHHVVSDPVRRAHWLVRHLGGPGEDEERSMPPEFLQEVLEWNETIEDARAAEPGSPERAALDRLATELEEARATVMAELGELLTPLPERGAPELTEARRRLNALRYVDRALREIGELRLATTA